MTWFSRIFQPINSSGLPNLNFTTMFFTVFCPVVFGETRRLISTLSNSVVISSSGTKGIASHLCTFPLSALAVLKFLRSVERLMM
eukprot:9277119-Ditylum_brightwellii.AAC.1